MPRGKVKGKIIKDVAVNARVPKVYKEILTAYGKQHGITLSELVRRSVIAMAELVRKDVQPAPAKEEEQ